MEIIPDGIIDESLSCFGFTAGLVLEHHIIIPPTQKSTQNPKEFRSRRQTNRVNSKKCHFFFFFFSRRFEKYLVSNLLFTLKEVGLLSSGFPRRSSASFTLSSSSCCCRSCRHICIFYFCTRAIYIYLQFTTNNPTSWNHLATNV